MTDPSFRQGLFEHVFGQIRKPDTCYLTPARSSALCTSAIQALQTGNVVKASRGVRGLRGRGLSVALLNGPKIHGSRPAFQLRIEDGTPRLRLFLFPDSSALLAREEPDPETGKTRPLFLPWTFRLSRPRRADLPALSLRKPHGFVWLCASQDGTILQEIRQEGVDHPDLVPQMQAAIAALREDMHALATLFETCRPMLPPDRRLDPRTRLGPDLALDLGVPELSGEQVAWPAFLPQATLGRSDDPALEAWAEQLARWIHARAPAGIDRVAFTCLTHYPSEIHTGLPHVEIHGWSGQVLSLVREGEEALSVFPDPELLRPPGLQPWQMSGFGLSSAMHTGLDLQGTGSGPTRIQICRGESRVRPSGHEKMRLASTLGPLAPL